MIFKNLSKERRRKAALKGIILPATGIPVLLMTAHKLDREISLSFAASSTTVATTAVLPQGSKATETTVANPLSSAMSQEATETALTVIDPLSSVSTFDVSPMMGASLVAASGAGVLLHSSFDRGREAIENELLKRLGELAAQRQVQGNPLTGEAVDQALDAISQQAFTGAAQSFAILSICGGVVFLFMGGVVPVVTLFSTIATGFAVKTSLLALGCDPQIAQVSSQCASLIVSHLCTNASLSYSESYYDQTTRGMPMALKQSESSCDKVPLKSIDLEDEANKQYC